MEFAILQKGKIILTGDKALYLFISLFYFRGVFVDTLGNVFSVFGLPTSPVSITYYLIMWCCLAFSLIHIVSQCAHNKWVLLFFFTVISILSIYALLFPQSARYIYIPFFKDIPAFATTCILSAVMFAFVGSACKDFDALLPYLIKVSKFGVICAVLRMIIKVFVLKTIYYDDMSFAYELCTMVCILGADFILNKHKNLLVYLILGIFVLFVAGTRGPLLIVLVLLVMSYILSGIGTTRIAIAIFIAFAIGIAIKFGAVGLFAEWLSSIFQKFGLTSRIIDLMLEGSLSDGSGRAGIQKNIVDAIAAHPLIGNGIGMDQTNFGYYAHNIVLEILYNFGIPIGASILLWLLVMFTTTIIRSTGSFRIVILALFCSSVIKLMFSQTYITSRDFFLLIGFMLCKKAFEIRKNRKANG